MVQAGKWNFSTDLLKSRGKYSDSSKYILSLWGSEGKGTLSPSGMKLIVTDDSIATVLVTVMESLSRLQVRKCRASRGLTFIC